MDIALPHLAPYSLVCKKPKQMIFYSMAQNQSYLVWDELQDFLVLCTQLQKYCVVCCRNVWSK